MQGVEILNKTEVMIPNDNWVIIAFILIGITLILGGVATRVENRILAYISLGGVILCMLSALIVAIVYRTVEIPSGRYRYEAIIQDDVSINEVYEHYKVIKQEGKIWVLEDKESD